MKKYAQLYKQALSPAGPRFQGVWEKISDGVSFTPKGSTKPVLINDKTTPSRVSNKQITNSVGFQDPGNFWNLWNLWAPKKPVQTPMTNKELIQLQTGDPAYHERLKAHYQNVVNTPQFIKDSEPYIVPGGPKQKFNENWDRFINTDVKVRPAGTRGSAYNIIDQRVYIDPQQTAKVYNQSPNRSEISPDQTDRKISFNDPNTPTGHQANHFWTLSQSSSLQTMPVSQSKDYDKNAPQVAQGRVAQNRARAQFVHKLKTDPEFKKTVLANGATEEGLRQLQAYPEFFAPNAEGLQQFRNYHDFLDRNPAIAAMLGPQANRRSLGYQDLRRQSADVDKSVSSLQQQLSGMQGTGGKPDFIEAVKRKKLQQRLKREKERQQKLRNYIKMHQAMRIFGKTPGDNQQKRLSRLA